MWSQTFLFAKSQFPEYPKEPEKTLKRLVKSCPNFQFRLDNMPVDRDPTGAHIVVTVFRYATDGAAQGFSDTLMSQIATMPHINVQLRYPVPAVRSLPPTGHRL